MTKENITRRNALMQRIQSGERLSHEERLWLQAHPIYSTRYGQPYIICDMLSVEPGREVAITVTCLQDDPDHPIVRTFTIPFEQNGFIRLAAVATSDQDFRKMRNSTKFSMRMISGITAVLRCRSDSGILMVSYQGWVPDNQPIPMWFETIRCPRFAMEKTVISENMVQYGCCGADMTSEELSQEDAFDKFRFAVNWYTV